MAQAHRTTSHVRLLAAGSLAALSLGMAMPAMAQQAQAQTQADENTSESAREIVVTAQFREQRLQDTPLSITAVDAQLLASRNQTDIAQIAQQAPNVQLNAMGGAYGSSLGAASAVSASLTSTLPMSRASASMSTTSVE
jgi:iron complex outermembrane receptor protein